MKIGLFLHPDQQLVAAVVRRIIDLLLSHGVEVILPDSVSQDINGTCGSIVRVPQQAIPALVDAVFSVGGDGTFLGAARLMVKTNKPILGIHIGGLGFMADVQTDNLEARVEAFLNGGYALEHKIVLAATVSGLQSQETYYAFNEFVIDRGHVLKMIKIKTFVENEYFNTYRADGLIIATPTGSTAYSLSAGGPIISPNLNVIAISPICPHSLSARPVIISANQPVRIDCSDFDADVSLVVDGQIRILLQQARQVEIQKAAFYLPVVRFRGDSFFQTLRVKMNWGRDIRGN